MVFIGFQKGFNNSIAMDFSEIKPDCHESCMAENHVKQNNNAENGIKYKLTRCETHILKKEQ